MGFLPEIRKILRYLPSARQTLCFSATMPPEIRTLTKEMMKSPVNIQRDRVAAPPSAITQAVYPVNQDLKTLLLVELLKRGDIKQALVFTRTKHRANRLADALDRHGIQTGRIHGNRSQAQRQAALEQFKTGRIPVLVATDIVARGIDVEQLGHVVNFDVPLVPEDYVHRVGRTGRADATGEAFTFVAPEERQSLIAIERAIGKPLQRVTVADFDYDAKAATRLEIPLAQRIAEIRKRKADDRARGDARRNRAGVAGHRAGGGPSRPGGGARSRQEHPARVGGAPASGSGPADHGRTGRPSGSGEGPGPGSRPAGGFSGRRFRGR
jgi:ATP-dependent RNA helicase RhlE